MRLILLVAALLASAQAPRVRVFVPVGAGYDGGASPARDFETMKSLGFNTVVLRGRGPKDELLALALRVGLHAIAEQSGAPPFLEPPPVTSADVRLRAWEAIARGARVILFPRWSGPGGLLDEDGTITPRARMASEFAGIVSRNALLFSALRPRPATAPSVRVEGDAQGVEGCFLESGTAMLLIAINHENRAQKVTLRFPPDTPEAIWQNLETGAAVSFVMGPDGPSLEHAFLARDVVVLVRAKRLQ